MPPADPRSSSVSAVRQMLADRTAAAIATARTTGDVSQAELDSLDRLAQLLSLEKDSADRRPKRAWALAIIFLLTLIGASVLLFTRVRQTEVALEVDATHVTFTTPSEQVLFEGVDLRELRVSGIARFTLPDAAVAAFGGNVPAGEPDQSIRLAVADIKGHQGAIGISELKPTKPTTVGMGLNGPNGEYRLSFQDPGMPIEVSLVGPIKFTIAGVGERLIDLPIPQSLTLEPAQGDVDLHLVFRDSEHAGMTPQVPVSSLEFWRVDEFSDRRLSVLRSLSTVIQGKIYFEELNETSRTLRAGEVLRFGHVQGELRTVRMRGDRLSLYFQGDVQGMSTGSSQSARSLMPTWLETVSAQQPLSLLWGTTVSVATLLVAALRWFKGDQ